MKLNIYSWEVLKSYFPNISFSKSELSKILLNEFSSYSISKINVVFTTKKHIKELNKEFRKKDSFTDVLSFVIEKEPLLGEIYICPEYIAKSYGEEEILRDIVHGILHLVGEDHKESFNVESEQKEEMFVKQENILQNIQYEINNRFGKSRRKISSNKA